jgi:hypothetical protein
MFKKQQIFLLLILGVTDAYLISHPNLIGKLGVFVYKYEMIKNFPISMVTVLSSLAICLLISVFLERQVGKKWAKYGLVTGLIISVLVLIQVYFKFSSGSYAHTGKGFKYGMHLLPFLFIYIFANGLWNWISANKSKQ